MAMYNRWSVPKRELIGITPQKAQDLIVQCFFEAQRETFTLSTGISDEAKLKQMVVETIKKILEHVNESFDKPTRQSLVKLVEELTKKESEWGTPKNIIMHHLMQIYEILRALEWS